MDRPTHPSTPGFPAALIQEALIAIGSMPQPIPAWGLSALQGTGKSTFAAQLAQQANAAGLRTAVLSLDDFYLTRDARKALACQVHPLLETRGPPGTHDLPLALATLDALRAGERVKLPRFDKLADDRAPESQWPMPEGPAQLVIFEGWCLGTPAQDTAELAAPLNALERDEDPDGIWRTFCNDALARDYPALWQRCDGLWFIQPPGFDNVVHWRWQAEEQLKAAQSGPGGMTRPQLERFVQHYERVSRQALRALPALADRVIRVDAQRRVIAG